MNAARLIARVAFSLARPALAVRSAPLPVVIPRVHISSTSVIFDAAKKKAATKKSTEDPAAADGTKKKAAKKAQTKKDGTAAATKKRTAKKKADADADADVDADADADVDVDKPAVRRITLSHDDSKRRVRVDLNDIPSSRFINTLENATILRRYSRKLVSLIPPAPKRPNFMAVLSQGVMNSDPQMDRRMLFQICGERLKSLSDEERKIYKDELTRQQEVYRQQNAEYNKTISEDQQRYIHLLKLIKKRLQILSGSGDGKKRLTPYNLFVRQEMTGTVGDAQDKIHSRFQGLAARWKSLPQEEKQKFIDLAAAQKKGSEEESATSAQNQA